MHLRWGNDYLDPCLYKVKKYSILIMQFVQVFVDIAHVFRGERFLFFLLLEIFTFRREKIVYPMAVKG